MLVLLATLGLCSAMEDTTFIGTQFTCPCKLGCGLELGGPGRADTGLRSGGGAAR